MKKFLCSLVFIIGFTLSLYGGSITAQTWQSGGQTGLTCAFNCGGAPRPGDACSSPGATTTCGAMAGSGGCFPATNGNACFHYSCTCAY